MKEFWSGRIRDIVPYTPGEQPKDRKFIKLNTNECPYPPSPRVLEAIQAVGDSLRLYPDLLVIQSSSKSRALAGLRVGWAMGNSNLIAGMRCVRDSINSYTVDRLAQAGAAAAVEDEDYFQSVRRRVMDARSWTARMLEEKGFRILPSQANFLFASHPAHSGRELLDGLRERGILVRWWDQPEIRDWLRITIGARREMEELARALDELV